MSLPVIHAVYEHSGSTGGGRNLMLALAWHAHTDGVAWPTQSELAAETKLSEQWVRAATRRLVGDGELLVARARCLNRNGGWRHGGRRYMTVYRIVLGDLLTRPVDVERLEAYGLQLDPAQLEPQLTCASTGGQETCSLRELEPQLGPVLNRNSATPPSPTPPPIRKNRHRNRHRMSEIASSPVDDPQVDGDGDGDGQMNVITVPLDALQRVETLTSQIGRSL